MDKLIGDGHQKVLSELWDSYHRANSSQTVQMVVIEGPTGFGKTRVVHEFYRQLAARQSEPQYWPEALSGGLETSTPDGWMKLRKRPYPDVFEVPPRAKLEWFWWGLICSQQPNGERTQSLWAGKSQFHSHLEKFGRSQSLGGRTAEAMDISGLALDILSVLQVAVPGAGIVTGANAVRNLSARVKNASTSSRSRKARRQAVNEGRVVDSKDAGRAADIADLAETTVETSKQLPFVVFIEDAQWADTTLIDFLERLMSQRDGRILIIATAWPESVQDSGQKSFRSLLHTGYGWVDEARLKVLILEEMTKTEMTELIGHEYRRFSSANDVPSEALIEAIFKRYGSRPLSVKALFALGRIQRTMQVRQLSENDIEKCPTDLDSLLREYFDQTPASVQQLMSLASLAGFEFNTTSVVEAGDELRITNPGLSLQQSDVPYGLIEVGSPNAAEFADPTLHQIAERKSNDFFGRDDRRIIVRRMVSFAQNLDPSIHSEETCRIGWTVHVSLAEKGLAEKSEAAKSAESLRRLHSRRYSYESSRRYARLAVEWTPAVKRMDKYFRDLLSELANLEYVMGAEATAEKLYLDLVRLAEAEQPVDRQQVLYFRHMYGVCLKKLGQYEDAIKELDYVRTERGKLGPQLFRDMYNSQHHLIICRRLLGQLVEAEHENRILLEDQRVLLGTDHEDCFATAIEIGRCLFERADMSGADSWFADLYQRAEPALGNHPYRWIILGERSRTLAELQLMSRAVELCESSVSGLSNLLGGRHPQSLRQRKYLAQMYASIGQRIKAISMLRMVLAAQETEYGDDDERSNRTRMELATLENQ